MSKATVAAAAATLVAANIAIALLPGCTTPHPFVLHGDEKSVEIGYYGDAVATALPLARQHCAQYERVPRLAYTGEGLADFDCVPR